MAWRAVGKIPERSGERGVALLVTLFAVTLLTVLVVDFMYSATGAERAAANQANSLRAYYLARSAVEVGIALLVQNERQAMATNSPQVDSLQSSWALPFPPMPVDGGWASLSIIDDTRKIDINKLISPNGQPNPQYLPIVERLLANLNLPPDILPALIDWLDPDSITSQGGAEANYYLRLVPPYEPRNGPMPTIGDLKLVRGINEAIFQQLKHFLTTAPTTQININTAPAEVLAAVAPQLAESPSTLRAILQTRQEAPFTNLSQLNEVSGMDDTKLPALFTTRSDYFTITGLGTFAGARTYVYATVRRNGVGPVLLLNWSED